MEQVIELLPPDHRCNMAELCSHSHCKYAARGLACPDVRWDLEDDVLVCYEIASTKWSLEGAVERCVQHVKRFHASCQAAAVRAAAMNLSNDILAHVTSEPNGDAAMQIGSLEARVIVLEKRNKELVIGVANQQALAWQRLEAMNRIARERDDVIVRHEGEQLSVAKAMRSLIRSFLRRGDTGDVEAVRFIRTWCNEQRVNLEED